jgi:hypothetical protein
MAAIIRNAVSLGMFQGIPDLTGRKRMNSEEKDDAGLEMTREIEGCKGKKRRMGECCG